MASSQENTEPVGWRVSRYNFTFPTIDAVLVYNANSGSVVKLPGPLGSELGFALLKWPATIARVTLSNELFELLRKGGFLVPHDEDEVEVIRNRYWEARKSAPAVVTITTTMDCNLGCYYCYEDRSSDELGSGDLVALMQHIASLVGQGETKRNSLHVDWYGGEPMLNVGFLEEASFQIQAYCEQNQIKYAASIISNGTAWPEQPKQFVIRHKIQQVQISFDGLKNNHERRRRYRNGHSPAPESSSFDKAVYLVDQLLDVTRVDVRFNIDKGNQDDLIPFFQFVRERGWFEREFPMTVQPARLASYSRKSAFMRSHEITVEHFDELRQKLREEFGSLVLIEESEVPDGYPFPRTSVCAALANGSSVVGADAKLYRCGLQVSEHGRSVGSLDRSFSGKGTKKSLPIVDSTSDAEWWSSFDPTKQPKCSVCSFLPICWSGCPKKHLEDDQHAIAEQGAYWRANLPRLIAARCNENLLSNAIDESVQFRSDPSFTEACAAVPRDSL